MPYPMHPILIAGPTAAGKSALALALAEATGGCIINADALQVYACWQVLSARPDEQQLACAPHFLYGHVAYDAAYSTGHWLREVAGCLAVAKQNNQRPIIVGGTGLYFSALTKGLAEIPTIESEIRNQGNGLRETGGTAEMLAYLLENDPDTHAQIDIINPARVQRAWEVLRSTGTGLAAWHRQTPPALVAQNSATCLVLDADRDWLADRIDRRFQQMLDTGALEEVRGVQQSGWQPALPAMQAIGARELGAYLQDELTLQQATEQGCAQSRQYAKRQRTWFRNRMKDWQRVPAQSASEDQELIREITTSQP